MGLLRSTALSWTGVFAVLSPSFIWWEKHRAYAHMCCIWVSAPCACCGVCPSNSPTGGTAGQGSRWAEHLGSPLAVCSLCRRDPLTSRLHSWGPSLIGAPRSGKVWGINPNPARNDVTCNISYVWRLYSKQLLSSCCFWITSHRE